MSRLREFADRLAGVDARSTPPLFDLLTGRYYGGGQPSKNSTVGYDAAQAHGAVYGSVDLLVRIVAWQMPAYSGDAPSTATVVVNPHPEPQMTWQHWRAAVLPSAILRGYAAGIVTEFEPSGLPRKVLPLHPDLVSWHDDRGRWRWFADGQPAELWQLGGNLWVAPSLRPAPDSPVGMSVLRYAAQKINLGLSATKFGGDFFDAGGMPVAHGKVTTPDGNITQQQGSELKRRVLETTRNREPLITGTNFDLSTIDINAEESQFLETIAANDAQVCMFFGIPPEAIGASSGASMTYDNLGAMNLRLLTNTVGAWMHWFESIYDAMTPSTVPVKLDPEALLRTSVSQLYDTAQKAVGRGNTPGVLTQNEARDLVGYRPIADGDKLYVPVNYAPIGVIEEVVQ